MPRSQRKTSPSPTTAVVARRVVQPVKGTDRALTIKTRAAGRFVATYWDLWFAIVAQRMFEGDFARLRAHLRQLRDQSYLYREECVAKLSHLNELRRRLEHAQIDAATIVEAAVPLSAGEVRRARGKVLQHSARRSERSQAMVQTPVVTGRQHALRGFWPQFPLSPAPPAAEILAQFNSNAFYSERQSFSVARRLDQFTARADRLARQEQFDESLAILRAVMTATIEVLQFSDDSFGAIGMSFQNALRHYRKLPLHETRIKASVFFPDLLTFVVWEEYGLTTGQLLGYFRRLKKEQAAVCVDYLRRYVHQLREDDLDYQAEEALTCWDRSSANGISSSILCPSPVKWGLAIGTASCDWPTSRSGVASATWRWRSSRPRCRIRAHTTR
jgi:hypothetical protein